MLDRQDIDALLVGALYGELSSADEAALTAHLDSHPGDRTALDDLKSVRAKFKTSRIFEVQHEPPQAVSALLLQEAARRAPKLDQRQIRTTSWFERFITAFVKHPAMAAAATLVLVVGVAGTVFLKNNAKGVEQTAAQPREENEKLAAPSGAVAWGSAAIGVDRATDSQKDSVAVGLAETGKEQQESEPKKGEGKAANREAGDDFKAVAKPASVASNDRAKAPAEHHRAGDLAFDEDGEADPSPRAQKQKAPAKEDYVAIGKDERQPKDLGGDKSPDANGAPGGMAGATTAGSTQTQSLDGPAQQSAKKPAPAPVVAAAPPPPPTSTPSTSVAKSETRADEKADVPKPDANLAWAKSTHARVTAFVKDGNCKDAAPLAIAIRNRAPDYYNSTLVTDRALKPCMQYIADTTEQREKAAAPKASRATDTR